MNLNDLIGLMDSKISAENKLELLKSAPIPFGSFTSRHLSALEEWRKKYEEWYKQVQEEIYRA